MMTTPKLSPEERLEKEKAGIMSFLEELAEGGEMEDITLAQITHRVMDRLNLADDLQVCPSP